MEDSRRALAELSAAWFGYPGREAYDHRNHRNQGKDHHGCHGKTNLEAAGEKVGLIGTLGAFMGQEHVPTVNTTPESYDIQRYFARMVEAGCRYAVMEVSSQGLKMHRVDGFTFDYGIFTNISPDHIGPDEHASFEEYLYYKSQLLKRCRLCAVNRDDEHFDEIVGDASCELVTFGMRADADYYTDRVDYLTRHGFMGIAFLDWPGKFSGGGKYSGTFQCLQRHGRLGALSDHGSRSGGNMPGLADRDRRRPGW